jgi:hypothetical protein
VKVSRSQKYRTASRSWPDSHGRTDARSLTSFSHSSTNIGKRSRSWKLSPG